MKKVLHILKNPNDAHALDLIKRGMDVNQVTILLIQDAAGMKLLETSGKVYVLCENLKKGEKASYPLVGYREMLKMIFENDFVVTW